MFILISRLLHIQNNMNNGLIKLPLFCDDGEEFDRDFPCKG